LKAMLLIWTITNVQYVKSIPMEDMPLCHKAAHLVELKEDFDTLCIPVLE
jgi:hypothetical protein